MFPGDQYNRQYGNNGGYAPPNGPPPPFPGSGQRGFGDNGYGNGGDNGYGNGGYNDGYNGGGYGDGGYNGYQAPPGPPPPPQHGGGYNGYEAPPGPPPQASGGYGYDGYQGDGHGTRGYSDGHGTRGYNDGGSSGGGYDDGYGQTRQMSNSNSNQPSHFPGQGYAQNDGYRGGNGGSYSQFPGDGYGNRGGYNEPSGYRNGPPPPPPPNNGGYGMPQGGYGVPQGGYNAGPPGDDYGVAPPINMPVVYHQPDDIDFGGLNFPEWHQTTPPPPPPGNMGGNYTQPSHGSIPKYNIPQELQQQASHVQLSNCSGRKRALLIGINYIGTKYKLRGCINDVHNIKRFIMEHFGFKESDMVILTDDQTSNPSRMPTHQNIIKAMKWLVSGARMNDSFFFHYSGHGNVVPCKTGDELDGNDETICPLDFEKNGQIIDDDMNAIMVRPLPPGARLTAIYDCCHSASALDLPFTYNHKGELKNEKAITFAGKGLMAAGNAYLKGDIASALMGLKKSVEVAMTGDQKLEKARQTKSSLGDVIMFSGCKDDQTSADAKEDLKFTGAMSHALISSMNENPRQTYVTLLQDIRKRLAPKYTQLPQLSSGRLMDMNTTFIM